MVTPGADPDPDDPTSVLEGKPGDPRVHAVMNLVLSLVFAALIVTGLAFVGLLDYSWTAVALIAALLMVLTYLVTY